MTFAEFKATGKDIDDLRHYPDYGFFPENYPEVTSGRVYCDRYWIECIENWHGAPGEIRTWRLTIFNQEWVSNDLEALERELYKEFKPHLETVK